MKGNLIVIQSDGLRKVAAITAPPTCAELQKIVGGYIQLVPYLETISIGENGTRLRCVAFCNEEGKLEGLPVNAAATKEWQDANLGQTLNDVLVGNIAIVTGDEELLSEL